jgi:hypothetical protein
MPLNARACALSKLPFSLDKILQHGAQKLHSQAALKNKTLSVIYLLLRIEYSFQTKAASPSRIARQHDIESGAYADLVHPDGNRERVFSISNPALRPWMWKGRI